jgi:hypothetical protein
MLEGQIKPEDPLFTWRAVCVRLYEERCLGEGATDVQEQSGRRPTLQRRRRAPVFIYRGYLRRLSVVRSVRPDAS